jgi:hypothetical protein
MTEDELRQKAEALTKELADQGKLMEAGWMGFSMMCIPDHAPKLQHEMMREAFYAGAQHLFASVITMFDKGEMPTAQDLERMSKVAEELRIFIAGYRAKHGLAVEENRARH